ncbi:MAG: c-type cytochrome biogenesis protein CcsB [Mariprofundaceae bacterium]
MTAVATANWNFYSMNAGKTGFARFYTYLGAIVGLSALYFFGLDGYETNPSRLLMLWGGSGATAGLIGSLAICFLKPDAVESKFSSTLVPWLDGALLMLLLASCFALLEPHRSLISYEDQTGLISGRIVMAMNTIFIFSAVLYLMNLFAPESFIGKLGTMSAWLGVYAGGSALLLRWYESYLISPDIGHAPVSNLYEVFILLFCITTLIYLSLEHRYRVRTLGAFIMPLVAAGVFFGIWLGSVGQADIKPLVPALQSYWMKIHVPLNFVGYGAFAVACGTGIMYLLRTHLEKKGRAAKLLSSFPTLDQLDDLTYKAVAVGFPAFTLATILGAAWAAEAWGGYWSWDPKETWALIVWLVYGAYLHVRITHGWRGTSLAWWVVAGFVITLFCFVGVNMYLSGLHSYGRLS